LLQKYLKYLITLRYIKLFSYWIAKHIQTERKESHKHRYTYYYGIQYILGTINEFLLIFIVGLLFNILPQILISTLSFILLRILSGGLHFDNYKICAYFSLLIFTIIGLLAKYIILSQTIIAVIFFFVFIIFFIYAPIPLPSRKMNENKKLIFKIIAINLLTGLYLTTNLTNNIIITNSITYGILLAGIITLPFINKLK